MTEKDLDKLIENLKSDDEDVREAAAEALGEIGGGRAVKALIATLKAIPEQLIGSGGFHGPRHDKEYRFSMQLIVDALGMTGDKLAVEPLIDTLDDGYVEVRRTTTQALVEIGEPAVPALIDALGSWCGTTRSGAAEALKEIGWKPGTDELRALFLIALENWEECIELGDLAVEPLIVALEIEPKTEEVGENGRYFSHEAEYNIRFGAAEALGFIGDTRAIKPLNKVLDGDEDDEDFREAVVRALKKLGHEVE